VSGDDDHGARSSQVRRVIAITMLASRQMTQITSEIDQRRGIEE
jgi:hypothetical protein